MIEAQGLVFSRQDRRVIDDVSLQVPSDHVLGVVGPNGSGKTTLLKLLYGSLRPERGSVLLDGELLEQLSRREISRRLAVVAQSEHSDVALSVADTVLLGRLPHRSLVAAPRPDDYDACAAALNRMGIGALAQRLMSQISGGEAQRALIARALVQSSGVILLDEPTNHLDLRLQHQILGLVRTLGASVVVVLHDLNLAARYCDSLLLLDDGKPVASGTPEEVLCAEILEPVYGVPISVLRLPSGRIHLLLAEDCDLSTALSSPT